MIKVTFDFYDLEAYYIPHQLKFFMKMKLYNFMHYSFLRKPLMLRIRFKLILRHCPQFQAKSDFFVFRQGHASSTSTRPVSGKIITYIKIDAKKDHAPSGNRTRVARMGILHDTTTPTALDYNRYKLNIYFILFNLKMKYINISL